MCRRNFQKSYTYYIFGIQRPSEMAVFAIFRQY
jgi:hypothetical protein